VTHFAPPPLVLSESVLSNESVDTIEVASDSARVRWAVPAVVPLPVPVLDRGRIVLTDADRSRSTTVSLEVDLSGTRTTGAGAVA
jgi:hypothetical protein